MVSDEFFIVLVAILKFIKSLRLQRILNKQLLFQGSQILRSQEFHRKYTLVAAPIYRVLRVDMLPNQFTNKAMSEWLHNFSRI